MGAYNEELVKAGVMLDGDGLRPSSYGARVRFDEDGNATVIDGPFAETKELVSGYWVFEVSSREEAVEWAAQGALPRRRAGDPPVLRRRGLRRRVHARAAARRRTSCGRRTASAARDAHSCPDGVGDRGPAPRRRRRLAHGVRPHRRCAHPRHRRRRPGRGARPGRAGRRTRAVAGVRRAGQAGRLAHGHRQAPRHRLLPPVAEPAAQDRRAGPRARSEADEQDWAAALDEVVEDDVLRLVFISCHPVLSREARVALTLRLVGGLTTDEIARAFLVPRRRWRSGSCGPSGPSPPRACRSRCRPARTSPPGSPRCSRCSTWSSTRATRRPRGRTGSGRPSARRRCGWAASSPGSCPAESEVHGLVALMEIQASRLAARVGPDGESVLLADQDRSRWDRVLISRGLAALDRAEEPGRALGPYALQAAIAACHARARSVEETDWARDRRALRGARRAHAVPGDRAEPRRRRLPRLRPGRRAGAGRRAGRRPGAARLPPAAQRARRPAGAARPRATRRGRSSSGPPSLTRNERERALLLDRAAACGRGSAL